VRNFNTYFLASAEF